MNILLAAMSLDIGGAETHVLGLAKELKKMGHKPIVISTGGVYVKELEDNDISHYEAPLNKKDIINLTKSVRIIWKIVNREKVHLLHGHGRIPALNCKLISVLKGIPFMTTAHAKFKASLIYRYTSFWGKEVICISEDIKDHLINKFNVQPKKITIIPNGIDIEKFSPKLNGINVRDELKLNDDTIKIVYISRISGSLTKLVKMVIETGKEVYKEMENIDLIVAGDGEDFKEICEVSDRVNSEANRKFIHILGKRTDVAEIFSLASLAISVSRSALEAMACGKPVILAGGEGYMGLLTEKNIDAAISNNFTGRTSDNEISVQILKKEILEFLHPSNEERRSELGNLGRKVVKERFSIEAMAQNTVDIYTKLLKGV